MQSKRGRWEVSESVVRVINHIEWYLAVLGNWWFSRMMINSETHGP